MRETNVHDGRPTRKQVPLVSASNRTTSARPGPPKDRVPAPAPPSPPGWRSWTVPLGVATAFAAVLFFNPFAKKTSAQNFSYTGFVNEVTTDKVSTATITSTGSVSGKLKGGVAYTSQIPTALNDDALRAPRSAQGPGERHRPG
jgi:cell division protease FtsH